MKKEEILLRLAIVLILLSFYAQKLPAQTSTCVSDPKNCQTVHEMTFASHVNTTITTAVIDGALSASSNIIQSCNGSTDVACQITLQRMGTSIGSFGAQNDKLDVITMFSQVKTVLADNSAYVKFITSAQYSKKVKGKTQLFTLFGAALGSSILMVKSNRSNAQLGQTFAHEFGHTRGLHHDLVAANGRIMFEGESTSSAFTKVTKSECLAFHKIIKASGIKSTQTCAAKKVNVAFLIDDTGSMSQEISGVKASVLRKLSEFTPDEGLLFQLVTYKDGAIARDTTSDLATISAQISALGASGGGDCPESVESALNKVKDNMEEGGQVFIFTDASPRSGISLDALTAELKASGIKVTSQVSGDCFPSSSGAFTGTFGVTPSTSSQSMIPYSENNDPTFSPGVRNLTGVLPELVSSVEAFSFMARETGGVFAFIPEVNSSAAGRIRYENTAFNILSGGISNAVVFAQPVEAPIGATLGIRLTTANSIFAPDLLDIIVSFSDTNLTVLDVDVINPKEIIATVNIGTAASLDFKDVTIQVEAFDFGLEISGEGIFQVSPATGLPTLTGVSPAIGGQGDVTDIVVSGLNTNFDASSTLSLGSGITISNVNAENPERISARIDIASAAGIGYRTLTVTTGTEVIDLPLAFLVTAPSCAITDIEAGVFIACDTSSNSFSQEVVVTYNAAPDSGFLVVNGQNFPILSSPQTVSLVGLPLDDSTISITAQFSEDALCTYIEEDILTPPTICIDILPNAPSNLTVDASTAFLVPFTWMDNSSNEEGFYLKRKTPSSTFQTIAILGPNVTSYTDTALIFGETLEYEVSAFNDAGESAASNRVSYAMPANFGRLDLRFTCYDAAEDSITWDVHNPNTQNHPYIFAQWWSAQRDTLFAPPGNSYFKTKNNPQNHSTYGDDNITGVWWADERLLPGQPNDVVFNIPLHVVCGTAKHNSKSTRAPYAGRIFTGVLAPKVQLEEMMMSRVANSIDVKPNPFSDKLYIESEVPHANAKILVINQMGQTVGEHSRDLGPAFSIDLSQLPMGIYLVKVVAGDISITKKIVKR